MALVIMLKLNRSYRNMDKYQIKMINENTNDITTTTLLQGDTLQRAIHLTNGGQLPFIFQPDSANNQVFAIAKFDQRSFNFTQKAPNIYSISLKIREIW